MLVLRPPPTFHDMYVGTPKTRQRRAMFEKWSFPEPSAGRGAFLIAGYYKQLVELQLTVDEFAESSKGR